MTLSHIFLYSTRCLGNRYPQIIKFCTSGIFIYGTICLPVGLERTTVAHVSAHRGREDKSACCLRRMWVMTRARFGSRCVRFLLGSTCNVMECLSVPQGRHRDRGVSVDGPFSVDRAVKMEKQNYGTARSGGWPASGGTKKNQAGYAHCSVQLWSYKLFKKKSDKTIIQIKHPSNDASVHVESIQSFESSCYLSRHFGTRQPVTCGAPGYNPMVDAS